MTVGELIKALGAFDPNASVLIQGDQGGYETFVGYCEAVRFRPDPSHPDNEDWITTSEWYRGVRTPPDDPSWHAGVYISEKV